MKIVLSQKYIKKIASMDVYIEGFTFPRVLDNILEIGFALGNVVNKFYSSIDKEEVERFQAVRYPELFSPDGQSDPFARSGVINFYCLGFSKNTIDRFCSLIKNYLKEQKVQFSSFQYEQIGPRRIKEMKERISTNVSTNNEDFKDYFKNRINFLNQMNGSEIRVVRIPIIHTGQDRNSLDLPPELNLSNGNANHIFGKVLKYNGEIPEREENDGFGGMFFTGASSFGPIDAKDLIRRIDYYLGEKQLQERKPMNAHMYYPEEGEEWKGFEIEDKGKQKFIEDEDINENTNIGPRVIDPGVDDSYVRERLVQVKEVAIWAINHGYKTIMVI